MQLSKVVSEQFLLFWCCPAPELPWSHSHTAHACLSAISHHAQASLFGHCLVGQPGSFGWWLGQAGLQCTKFFAGWQACQSWHTGAGRLAMCQKMGLAGLQCAKKWGWLACKVGTLGLAGLPKLAHWG
jgi:hypothetical protein